MSKNLHIWHITQTCLILLNSVFESSSCDVYLWVGKSENYAELAPHNSKIELIEVKINNKKSYDA